MRTFADAEAALRDPDAGGFAALSPAKTPRILNEAIRRLAEESEWIRALVAIGTTVAGVATFDLPENIVRMRELTIGGSPYGRQGYDTIFGLQSGRLQLLDVTEVAGVYAERFSEDGLTKQLEVNPAPEEDGLPIIGNASIWPENDLSGTDPLPFPPKFRRAVVDFAKAIAYEDLDENIEAGARYEQRAEARAQQLLLLGKSRTGTGPLKIPVAGHSR